MPTHAGETLALNAQFYMGRNRIINGAMEIDQRNAGALVTTIAHGSFVVDRFIHTISGGGAIDGRQVDATTATIGVTMPNGFKNALYLKCATADASIASGDYYAVQQRVEGVNCADLNFGLSIAKTVTISFWVRSSVTGTYGGSIKNSAGDRAYPFQYTIAVANTWEFKTVTIAGDTSGTWLRTTGEGLTLTLDLGSGSTRQGTVNTWGAGNYFTATGSLQWIATVNATFYLTGVQLEVGAVATPFERRHFTTELQLCQRYYCTTYGLEEAPGDTSSDAGLGMKNYSGSTSRVVGTWTFPVDMRAAPTVTYYTRLGTLGSWRDYNGNNRAMANYNTPNTRVLTFYSANDDIPAAAELTGHIVASAEL